MNDMNFAVGDKVRKIGGSYQADGTIVAAFRTLDDAERYVFEFDSPAGMLHIFGPSNLALRKVVHKASAVGVSDLSAFWHAAAGCTLQPVEQLLKDEK